jgi:hypothetical protein
MKLYTYLRIGLTFSVILVIFYFYSIKILNKNVVNIEEPHKATKMYEPTTERIEFKR